MKKTGLAHGGLSAAGGEEASSFWSTYKNNLEKLKTAAAKKDMDLTGFARWEDSAGAAVGP